MYEKWYDGSLGGDFLFRARAQCMDVNARNSRWSESRSKVCQMCDMGEDETVEHVVLECVKYARDRRCRYKGLTQKKFCVTCNIKIKNKTEPN
ncbi:hypothetical protein E2C01_071033 [Portunus trituberculatus]|uniref:Uncharacterized protein n=1 Tax=Portunus trituberculatus TaxID=210409 RepID=A0A5B7I3S9_PORTR|nr:hypothetical protein [Portunus trituberculatus]